MWQLKTHNWGDQKIDNVNFALNCDAQQIYRRFLALKALKTYTQISCDSIQVAWFPHNTLVFLRCWLNRISDLRHYVWRGRGGRVDGISSWLRRGSVFHYGFCWPVVWEVKWISLGRCQALHCAETNSTQLDIHRITLIFLLINEAILLYILISIKKFYFKPCLIELFVTLRFVFFAVIVIRPPKYANTRPPSCIRLPLSFPNSVFNLVNNILESFLIIIRLSFLWYCYGKRLIWFGPRDVRNEIT